MNTNPRAFRSNNRIPSVRLAHGYSGMSQLELLSVIFALLAVFCVLAIGAMAWKRGSDRSANIINIRNCQQAMRGHQGMNSQNIGDPFTRRDLETYLPFPRDVNDKVKYTPGDKHTEIGVLWLRVSPAGDVGGRYGMESPAYHKDW